MQTLLPGQSRVFASVLIAVIAIFAVMTLLAGLPTAERIPGFTIGIVILIAVTTGIGLVLWHLLLRPLPAGQTVVAQPLLTVRARQIIALFLTLGTLSIGIAGVWDEIWHVKYGIPFGEDFFWRPHMLLYFGLSTLVVVGGWSWWTVMRRGKGTLQQRFRANPLLAVSFVGGLFTIYAVGADPIWHSLYGSDIAPWSLPHLLILTMIFVMANLAITYHKSLMQPREWTLKLQFSWRDLLLVLVLVGALVDFLLILTIQWYAAASSERQMTQIMTYPVWLIAVFSTFLVTLYSTLVLHATRQIGTATLLGVLTFVVRFLLDAGMTGVREGTTPLWLMIPLMLSIDIWYAISIYRTQKPPAFWTTAIVVAAVFGVVGLPIIGRIFPFLTPEPVSMIIASGLTGLVGVWLGQLLGGLSKYGLADNEIAPAEKAASAPQWLNGSLYAAFAIFVLFFVVTATPPA